MSSISTRFRAAAAPAVFSLMLLAAPAQADFGLVPGGLKSDVLDSAGNVVPVPQAGSHPFVQRVKFSLNTKPNPFPSGGPEPIPDDAVKDVKVDLPPGLVGSPQSIPQCTTADFVPPGFGGAPNCPTASQIGVANIDFGLGPGYHQEQKLPIYNLVPSAGVAARFGFVPTIPVIIDLRVRTGGDYGVTATVRNVSQGLNIYGTEIDLWGVPADHGHDAERYMSHAFVPGDLNGNPLPSGLAPAPFVDLPAQCGVARSTSLDIASWQNPDAHLTYQSPGQEVGGCEKLSFDPSVKVVPESTRAGAPSGLSVDVKVPQSDNPNGVIAPPVKSTVVTFPPGVTVNPASANGLAGCSPSEIELDGPNPAACPAGSKLGDVRIETPLLENPVEGGVYLATQESNPFHSLLAIYMAVVEPQTGVIVKLAGRVSPDPATGQLTASFEDTPQLPFEKLHMQFKSGAGAPLTMPNRCGTYTTHAELTSWAQPAKVISSDSSFVVSEGCDLASRFAPGLEAGTDNPSAGRTSPFVLRVTRQDGEQNIARIDTTLPEGLLAKLAGVPLCGDAQAASGVCPASSQVGTTTVGAGAGSNPIYVPQPGKAPTAVYLAGPYKGAPYSLVVKVPAQAGPFDLGTVTVRNGIYIDPVTTQASVKSDPLPQILQGIPLSYRDVRVEVNRPGFTLNPTSCERMKVESAIVSAAGASANPSAPFQAAGCGELDFQPKLALRLSGPTHRSAHPKLRAVLTARKGDANIGRAQVTLPKTEFLENAHIQTICTRVQFAADACPAKSVYGYAKAWSPLLDRPLSGPVYLRSSNHELPDLVASLDGQIHVDLQGRIDSVRSRIRNTFDFLPDAPVSKFVLTMQGGKKGLLVNNTELCKATPRAEVAFDGQNGKVADSNPVVKTDCGRGKK
jgi:hypothetical protein